MSRLVYGWLTALIAGMPLALGYALADLLTEVHFRFFPARRHAALTNLAVMMPRATRRERVQVVRRMMRSYNRMMFEFFRLPHLTRKDLLHAVEVTGREHLEQAVARGRGVILSCTHIGNWELAAVVLAHWLVPGPAGQAGFALAKLWLLGFPAGWWLLVEKGRWSWSPVSQRWCPSPSRSSCPAGSSSLRTR